jgi:hypothetical protein
MARHRRRLAFGLIAVAIVIATCVASAIGTTPETTTHTYTGRVARNGDASDRWPMTVASGSTLKLVLHWHNDSSDLNLLLKGPGGDVLAKAYGATAKPETLRIRARTSGTYTAVIWAHRGDTRYTLEASITANSDPLARADSAATAAGQPVAISVLANDHDPNNDALHLTEVATPGHGTASDVGSGEVLYTPEAGFAGEDSFSYRICDDRVPAGCDGARVTVTVGDAGTAGGTTDGGGSTDGSGSGDPGTGVSGGLLPGTAPRPDMTNPVTIQLRVGDDSLHLDDSRDYILQMPAQKKTGSLEISGGRNIELIGGYFSTSHSGTANIVIADGSNAVAGRVVRIEGVLIDASSGAQSDGIRIRAPKAVVEVVNTRITGLLGSIDTTHADVIQPFGGVRKLIVDGFTGSSHYNLFYLRRENNPLEPAIGDVVIRNANVFGYTNPDGTTPGETIRAISVGTQPLDPQNSTSSLNCDLGGSITMDNFYGAPAGKRLGQFMWPDDRMQTAGCPAQVSADGQSVTWPALRASGQVSGSLQLGAPPAGDFVPVALVGLNYLG